MSVGEITAFNLDDLCKRMLIGDSLGNIVVYNVLNGALIKTLPKHSAEITKIINIADKETFITASMDNTIKISDDNKINESELIRSINWNEVAVRIRI